MPRRILTGLRRNREVLERASLALVLPFVAGMVNAEGFFIVGVYTSHVTGTVASAGGAIARGQLAIALPWLAMVAAFFAGAAAATALVERARLPGEKTQRSGYARALGMEALTLSLVTAIGLLDPEGAPGGARNLQMVATLLLSYAMGAQNALVSKLSGAVVRNTHLTGIVTDLGIEAVRAGRWFRRTVHDLPWAGVLHLLANLRQQQELRRLGLHSAIFGSFFAGAVLGPLMYLREGYVAMLLPIGVLGFLMLFDVVIGLRGHEAEPLPASEPPPRG